MSLRLRRAAATAERVAAGDLDARIGATGGDEVAAMSDAVDLMAEALQERLEREQRFVADVAHDLRTPLTGLTAAASLLDDDQVGGAIKERVWHLSGLVEVGFLTKWLEPVLLPFEVQEAERLLSAGRIRVRRWEVARVGACRGR